MEYCAFPNYFSSPLTHLDSILKQLEKEECSTQIVLNSARQDPAYREEIIRILRADLILLESLLKYIANADGAESHIHLRGFMLQVENELVAAKRAFLLASNSDGKPKRAINWMIRVAGAPVPTLELDTIFSKIKLLRPSVKDAYNYILNCSIQSQPSIHSLYGWNTFMGTLRYGLQHLCDSPGLNLPLPVKEQLNDLAGNLISLDHFISSISSYEYLPFKDLFSYFGAALLAASHLCYLCWVDNKLDDNFSQQMVINLCHVQKILKFNSTKSIDILLKLITFSMSATQDREAGKLIQGFLSSLVPVTGEWQEICKGLNFLLRPFVEAPDVYKEAVTVHLMDISAAISEVESLNYSSNHHLGLHILIEKMQLLKAEAVLQDLLNQKPGLVVPLVTVKDQIDSIIEGLSFLGTCDLQDPSSEMMEGSRAFWKHVEAVIREAGAIYHSFHAKEITEYRVKDRLPELLEKIKIFKLEALLKKLLISRIPRLKVPFKGQIRTLYEGLIFLRPFLMLPLVENDKLIWTSVESVAGEAGSVYHKFHVCEITENVVEKMNCLLPDILAKTMLLKADILKIYDEFQRSVRSNFPKIHELDFVDFILGNLREMPSHKANAIASVKHQIEVVYHGMEIFRSFLENMSGQLNEHLELKDLHSRIIDVASQAEYIIDSLVVKGGASWCHLQWLSDLVKEIELIKVRIAKISAKKTYDIGVPNAVQTLRNTISSVSTPRIDEVIVDLPDQAELVIDHLTRGASHQDVAAIVGMPGLGKTTLAKKVYNEPSIMYHFHIRAWAYVSQSYQKRNLLIDILSDIKVERSHDFLEMSDEDLELELYQSLKGRKYLVVLDDMWSIEAWNDLERSFPDDQNGSRVLITSRYHDVAVKTKPNSSPHHLRQLTDDESWELLQKKLFDTQDFPVELLKVGQQIAKNCKGLPLAVVAVAGLLKGADKLHWWKQVADSLSTLIVGDPRTRCMDILDLSYKHLPDYLKPCFLYLGSFLEDREIPVSKLKLLWISEGLIPKRETESSEEVAERYLIDLIDRSLVMVAKRRSRSNGVKACRVHDMLRELCFVKCKEENFSQLITGYDELFDSYFEDLDYGVDPDYSCPSNFVTYEKHRLSICSKRNHFVMLRPLGQHVRSLLFFARSDSYPTCPYDVSFVPDNFKLLRVLDLESINMGSSFPRGIQDLVRLRYLAVSGDINSIPPSIDSLKNLETFVVKGLRGKIDLPETIWSMKRLRHVHVNTRALFRLQDKKHEKSSQLDNLVTLSSPSLSCGKDSEKIIRRLPNLQKLRCIFSESMEDVGQQNRFSALEFLTKLESLKIFYSCRNPYLGTFLFPLNLKKLTLSNFRLPWEYMSEIGKLPKLEVLKLLSRAFEGKTWDMAEGEFQELKFLKLDSLDITEWNAFSEHLPKLQKLVLRNCRHLEEVPSGFCDISTLEMVEVRFCKRSTEESVRRLRDDFEDLKVVINLSEY